MLYSLTSWLSTNHPTISTNLYSPQTLWTNSLIENIDILPHVRPILYYLTKSIPDNITQQASDILSFSERYTAQHSSSFWYSINFRALCSPAFNKPLIFYQCQSKIQPSIHQASGILLIPEHYPSQHPTNLLYPIKVIAIYSKIFTLYSEKLQLIFDTFHSKHKLIDPPLNQISEQKLLIASLSIKLKEFQGKWYHRSKQEK